MSLRTSAKRRMADALAGRHRQDAHTFTLESVEGCLRRLDAKALPAEAHAEVDRAIGYIEALQEYDQETVGALTES